MITQENTIEVSIGSALEYLDLVQLVTDCITRFMGFDEDSSHWIGMSVRESVTNAIQHGNKLDQNKKVDIRFEVSPEQLDVYVTDQGNGFRIEDLPSPLDPAQDPVSIVENALDHARKKYYDVVIVDTAGRLHVDEKMMDEIKRLHAAIKPIETLEALDKYKPLVTFDNVEELRKIRKHAPNAGLVLRLRVPNTGSMVELSSKFGAHPGEAVDLIVEAFNAGVVVEGISFHVGSQCTNFENYVQALQLSANIIREAEERAGQRIKILDIGGGFPVRYNPEVKSLKVLARKLNTEIKRLFTPDTQILAEPGRFMVANACTVVAKVIGKAVRDGKKCYYINDGIYHTYSGQIFDHVTYPVLAFREGEKEISAVFGPTCDAFDTITLGAELPELGIGDLVYSENIGAYSHASSTYFNGFPPAKVVHINR